MTIKTIIDNQTDDVRQLQGEGWQVRVDDPQHWRTCRNELDARYIANALQMAAAVRRGELCGEEAADELDEAAATVLRNLGAGAAEQSLRASAALAREGSKLDTTLVHLPHDKDLTVLRAVPTLFTNKAGHAMTHKKPEPLMTPERGCICPICGKRAYSRGGIHPQCAARQADAPRQKMLAEEKKVARDKAAAAAAI